MKKLLLMLLLLPACALAQFKILQVQTNASSLQYGQVSYGGLVNFTNLQFNGTAPLTNVAQVTAVNYAANAAFATNAQTLISLNSSNWMVMGATGTGLLYRVTLSGLNSATNIVVTGALTPDVTGTYTYGGTVTPGVGCAWYIPWLNGGQIPVPYWTKGTAAIGPDDFNGWVLDPAGIVRPTAFVSTEDPWGAGPAYNAPWTCTWGAGAGGGIGTPTLTVQYVPGTITNIYTIATWTDVSNLLAAATSGMLTNNNATAVALGTNLVVAGSLSVSNLATSVAVNGIGYKIVGTGRAGGTDMNNGAIIGLSYNAAGNHQLFFGESETGAGSRFVGNRICGWNLYTSLDQILYLGNADGGPVQVDAPLTVAAGFPFSATGNATISSNLVVNSNAVVAGSLTVTNGLYLIKVPGVTTPITFQNAGGWKVGFGWDYYIGLGSSRMSYYTSSAGGFGIEDALGEYFYANRYGATLKSNLVVAGSLTASNGFTTVAGSTVTNLHFWTGTTAMFAALTTTNANTFYIVIP